MRIHNNNFQRSANISLVAQSLWRKPGISRIEISRELSLYRSTVSNIIQTLIDHRLVYEAETGEGTSSGGRKPVLLRLNEAFGCVLGIELQPSGYRAALVDINGRLLAAREGGTPERDFTVRFRNILHELQPFVESVRMPLLGVGTGLPGAIDPDNGVVIVSEPLGLVKFPFYEAISSAYPVPVVIENDANCCAWGQLMRHRERRTEDFICLYTKLHDPELTEGYRAGLGIGLGTSINGQVYYGKGYAAGEFVSTSWEPGLRGQFGFTDESLLNLSRHSDLYRDVIVELFRSLIPVITTFDPEVLFVHGELCSHEELVRRTLQERLPTFSAVLKKMNCGFEFPHNDGNDVALGAAAMFLQKLFSVPQLSDAGRILQFDWDEVFASAARKSIML